MVKNCPGTLFIVAAPSGGGKTSLVKHLVEHLRQIEISISHTTRASRPGESHGVDYFYIDEPTFLEMIKQGDFIEYAQVFQHYYGTSSAQIDDRLQAGIDVVLDIDWQGAQQIRQQFPDAVSIFIIPPSLEALRNRLNNRQQDEPEVIQHRMQKAHDELSHYPEFDYLIINETFEKAAAELQSIVIAERLRIKRQILKQQELLSFLLSSK